MKLKALRPAAAAAILVSTLARAQTASPCIGAQTPDSVRLAATGLAIPQGPVTLDQLAFVGSPDTSSLFTLPMTRLRIAQVATPAAVAKVAAEIDGSRMPTPLAWTSQSSPSSASRRQADVAWLASTVPGQREAANLQAIEYLYQASLQLDPLARYALHGSLGESGRPRRIDHGAALATIAAKRNCVAADWAGKDSQKTFTKWESVRIDAVAQSARVLDVAVVVPDGLDRPVGGAEVSFARGSHFTCSATTDSRGLARCTLWDAHGHVDATDEDARAPTVAIFGGKVASDFIQLPTTYAWAGSRKKPSDRSK